MLPESRKIAFYPCCAHDIREPHQMLTGIVDEIIYCDIYPNLRDDQTLSVSPPTRQFWREDALQAIARISHIDVLFYRRDGTSEGGSGLFILGERIFPLILAKMRRDECRIITDGSNSRGGRFRKMNRASGLSECGKIIKRAEVQRFESFGLTEFIVRAAS